jgi:hypothetical protein
MSRMPPLIENTLRNRLDKDEQLSIRRILESKPLPSPLNGVFYYLLLTAGLIFLIISFIRKLALQSQGSHPAGKFLFVGLALIGLSAIIRVHINGNENKLRLKSALNKLYIRKIDLN